MTRGVPDRLLSNAQELLLGMRWKFSAIAAHSHGHVRLVGTAQLLGKFLERVLERQFVQRGRTQLQNRASCVRYRSLEAPSQMAQLARTDRRGFVHREALEFERNPGDVLQQRVVDLARDAGTLVEHDSELLAKR